MEVPYQQNNDEEVVGMDLQTRRRSHPSTIIHNPTTYESENTNNNNNTLSESSKTYKNSATMNTSFITNGENLRIIKETSTSTSTTTIESQKHTEVISADDVVENEVTLEENANSVGESENGNDRVFTTSYEGIHDYYMQQNGAGAVSLSKTDAGDKKVDDGSNGTSFPDSPTDSCGFKYMESFMDENSSSIKVTPPEILAAETEQNIVNEILKSGQTEVDVEAIDYDVEGVLQKQETHDLFCPNCKSCITKRVVLRRRKRKIGEVIKPDVDEDQNKKIERDPEYNAHPAGGDPDETVGGLTCFSCLSIFIPTGNGFLFWRRKPDINVLQAEPAHTTALPPKEPSLPSREVRNSTGETLPYDEGTGKVFPLWILTCCQPYEDEKRPNQPEKPDIILPKQPENPDIILPEQPENPDIILPKQPENPITILPKQPEKPYPILPKPQENPEVLPDSEDQKIPNKGTPSHKPGKITLDEDISLPPNSVPRVPPGGDTQLPPKPKPPVKPDTGSEIYEVILPMPGDPSKNTNLTVIMPDKTPTQPTPNIEAPPLESPREPHDPGVSGVEFIKAIVYGGLLESITSLSVITSSAGGDATTLNIVALGLANVIGGLLVLLHSLRILNQDHTSQHYEDQLGKKGNFLVHATISVISYLVFGLMPPLVYGFTFRKSDDKNLKILVLAAASIVCITILSLGKAYTRRPPKKYIQTLFYYVSTGVMVSGLGYVSGQLINDLLKKLGVFDSRSAVNNMPVLNGGATQHAWSSY